MKGLTENIESQPLPEIVSILVTYEQCALKLQFGNIKECQNQIEIKGAGVN